MKRKLNYLDGFSGCGGFHKGLESAGFKFKNVYFSEKEKNAIANYKFNYPKSKHAGSIETIRRGAIGDIDLFTFGSPCQDFSSNGTRQGLKGVKSSLIGESIRIVSEFRPSVFIWENVKGAFSTNDGADFWAIIQAFANIGSYRLQWQLCDSNWLLPHDRKRIYLVGTLRETGIGGIFPIVTEGPAIDCAKRLKREYIKIYANTKEGFDHLYDGDGIDLSFPTSKTRRGRVTAGRISTLDRACNKGVFVDGAIRRLTPIECERLQGLPDDWTRYGNYNGEIIELSKSQRYSLCGNGVSAPIVEAIGKNILKFWK